MYLLGYDLGSSSIKAALVDAETLQVSALTHFPKTEMEIISVKNGWAEQDPNDWWHNLLCVTQEILNISQIDPKQIASIGVAYQMHGLVPIDRELKPVRPSIIWCDSRAVQIGDEAYQKLGPEYCQQHLLNSPGNFTASKLKWMQDHEPEKYKQLYKVLLPGDYVIARMTGEPSTTISGLSEGIFWDFKEPGLSNSLMQEYSIDEKLIPPLVETFGVQGMLCTKAAEELGLEKNTPVSYRAGDQPNNALSLGVFQPGEFAGTGGTSGVLYGVTDHLISDPENRVNSFAHVNYSPGKPRIGVLLCINGAGAMYNWIRKNATAEGTNYNEMEELAKKVPVGSEGLSILPFGNGAERMLKNKSPGTQISGMQLNVHGRAQLIRAALEGIAFAFVYGAKFMQGLGMQLEKIKVGNDNLFQSGIFAQTISNLIQVDIHVSDTSGAIGAAIASGVGIKYFNSLEEAFSSGSVAMKYQPQSDIEKYEGAYRQWLYYLNNLLN